MGGRERLIDDAHRLPLSQAAQYWGLAGASFYGRMSLLPIIHKHFETRKSSGVRPRIGGQAAALAEQVIAESPHIF